MPGSMKDPFWVPAAATLLAGAGIALQLSLLPLLTVRHCCGSRMGAGNRVTHPGRSTLLAAETSAHWPRSQTLCWARPPGHCRRSNGLAWRRPWPPTLPTLSPVCSSCSLACTTARSATRRGCHHIVGHLRTLPGGGSW